MTGLALTPGETTAARPKARRACRWLIALWLVATVLVTFAVRTYHAGVFPRPDAARLLGSEVDRAEWIDRERFGMHQLVLQGSAFGRGRLAGQHTRTLLEQQETELTTQLKHLIPSKAALQLLVLSSILWFNGIERYFEPWASEEMYGIALSAPTAFDHLTDGFTRQIAYHGLHEVGQLMVDSGFEGMACTVAAVPIAGNWVLGRNFDFEGGRTFDEEKILKWVFPDQGNAYVSVIWAGMVGAVTGVNEHGLYLSLNAAGSDDFRRIGTPSTLVLLKALQFASTAAEALQIIRDSTMFITDIFVLLDAKSGELYRIEKSPRRTVVQREAGPTVIANHLILPEWQGDSVNEFRKRELTSTLRQQRGQARIEELHAQLSREPAGSPDQAVDGVLSILRDKGQGVTGQPLHLGNRQAIDALIATHAVILDGTSRTLYVSQGPAVSGGFTAFDLTRSFSSRTPVLGPRALSTDPMVPPERFRAVHVARKVAQQARTAARKSDCAEAAQHLAETPELAADLAALAHAQGDVFSCRGETARAKQAWQQALDRVPAYAAEINELREKLAR